MTCMDVAIDETCIIACDFPNNMYRNMHGVVLQSSRLEQPQESVNLFGSATPPNDWDMRCLSLTIVLWGVRRMISQSALRVTFIVSIYRKKVSDSFSLSRPDLYLSV